MSSGIKSSLRTVVAATPPGGGGGGTPVTPPTSGVVTASFTTTPGAADGVVSFQASATTTVGNITGYDWIFGDGAAASGAAVAHTYAGNGPYTVTLVARDSTGSSASVSRVVTPPDVPTAGIITANFTATNSGNTSYAVGFSATATTSQGSISSYQWDFGDGTVGGSQNTAHTYSGSGPYTVTLTVRDSTGSSRVVTKTITPVAVAPVPSRSVKFTSAGTGMTGQATDSHRKVYGIPQGGTYTFTMSAYDWQGGLTQVPIEVSNGTADRAGNMTLTPVTTQVVQNGPDLQVTVSNIGYNENYVHLEAGYSSPGLVVNVYYLYGSFALSLLRNPR